MYRLVARTTLAATMALLLGFSPARAAISLTFDPDGAGSAAAVQVRTFDQLPGNAIAVGFNKVDATSPTGFRLPTAGETFQLLYQAKTGSLLDNTNTPVYTYGVAGANQLTFVASITEQVFSISTNTAQFIAVGGSLQIYYNAPSVASDAAGTGFTAGVKVYDGTLNTGPLAVTNTGNFSVTNPDIGLLDQSGSGLYPGVHTVGGTGSTALEFVTTFVNTSFFVGGLPPTLSILLQDLTTRNDLPFLQVSPAAQFFNGQAGATTVGSINGGADSRGNPLAGNVMFQSDGASTFTIAPEPGSIVSAVAGLLIGGVFAARRRRKA